MKILFTGGGSGGHLFPIIAIVREMRKISKENLEFFYIGPKDELSQILLSQEDIKPKWILAGKLRRYINLKSLFENLIDLLKVPIGVVQAFLYIFFLMPDLIFSKGGYGSIPAVISGWILRTPIFLHESDIAPGLANRFLAKFALEIFVSFPKTLYFPQNKMILVGNPIRREILESSREEGIEFFKLTGQKPIILVLGGSQGAQRINDKILENLNEMLENFEIIHQTGQINFKEVEAEAGAILKEELKPFYHPFPFLKEEQLKKAYAAADLVVARAGAGTIFEIAALGKPSILIPLPESAQGHQLKNAYAFSETGATIVIEEENFTSRFFLERLKYLFSHPEKLKEMGEAAKNFSKPFAALTIAKYLLSFLTS
jgi:UDP-N-acetylglucosamine--N-acetylmuramyl-(pentapeptide) pyrophosphoryl-undecaprenol N-acetylglucosamine transferase